MPEVPELDEDSREPALSVGVVTAVASALLAAFVAFGLDLTPEQTGAILAVVTLAAPIIAGWITRSKVFSPATVARLMRGASGNR